MEDKNGKIIPDAPMEGDERIEFHDDDGNLVGIADVGVGDPDDPYRDQLLSVEDERRLDSKGRSVVQGKLWSEAPTGLWLTVALGGGPLASLQMPVGGTSLSVPAGIVSGADYRLFVGTFRDTKPTFGVPTVGACLELPDDLGRDEIKRKYVTEWLAHTTVECFQKMGIEWNMNHETLGAEYVRMATMVCMAAEDAIKETGL